MSICEKKANSAVATALKKTCLIEQFYRLPALPYLNFILSASCNNENQLKATLQMPLAKDSFN